MKYLYTNIQYCSKALQKYVVNYLFFVFAGFGEGFWLGWVFILGVQFAFTHHTPVRQYWLFISHTWVYPRESCISLDWRRQQVVLEYTRIQSYNKIQTYDLDEWWDLRRTIRMRRLGRQPGTHTTIGRILKKDGSSIDNRWRVQTPSNVPMERSQPDLPTPPISLRVPPPLFRTKASQNLAPS